MKDEIKELLDYFKKYVNDKYETYTVVDIHTQNLRALLNYITNLQEEIKTLYRYTPEKGFELVGDDND